MKRILIAFLASGSFLATQAQLDLPQPSPSASVRQTVGLTDITIDYSAPGVKGREIFGSLVPYNELWRTGANMATKITFSTDISISGNNVPAGSYAIFTIPGESEWTFILNKNYNQGGTGNYKQEEDQLRIKVKPEACEFRERMAFQIVDFDDKGGSISLEWSKTRIRVPFTVETDKIAMKNIENALNGTWRNYASSARHLLEHDGDLTKALEYINMAEKLHADYWYITWIKAQILYKKGEKKSGIEYAKKAKEQGDKDQNFFWKSQVEQALKEWKA